MRIGQGFDIHRLVPDRKLIIGGVDIPFEKGLLGHSDADVLYHAITDALLGACAKGDIGTHFPDTDPQFKGKNSEFFLKAAAGFIEKEGYKIENIDCTIKIERPKMLPYIQKMRENIANALNIDNFRVNIKAKTNEGLGSVGEGLAAEAVAVVLIV